MLVDLRSDTLTKPSPEMRKAMAAAEVGDDDYGEDPTVNRLEETFAELTGKQAAMYVPSGVMANQVALRTLTRPGDAVVAGAHQHVVVYEEGAASLNAGVTFLVVSDSNGHLASGDIEAVIAAARHHQPKVSLICIEDTHMAAGGRIWADPQRQALSDLARRTTIAVHLDGARLWNAAVASGVPIKERARVATTVMCCLSKGLGAPVGSILAGPADLIEVARLHRKRMGGTMRQAGVLAAAGLVAMERGLERLAEDHVRARRLAVAVAERWPGIGFDPSRVETNIVLFAPPDAEAVLAHLAGSGVKGSTIAPGVVRLVTHADIDAAGIEQACQAIASAP